MAYEPKKITKEHVLAAVKKIGENAVSLRPSTKFNVIINGKAYPPKEVMRYAHEEMNGEYDWFESGGNPTNRYLENMGFEIEQKDSNDMTSLFKSTIEKLINAIADDSKIQFKQLTEYWAWFGDKQGMIGDPKTHYEVYFNKKENLISVDLHFEGSSKHKRQFQPILDHLTPPLKILPWRDGESIRYGEGISLIPSNLNSKVLGSDELVAELKYQLLGLEDKIGDKVRAILGKSNTEKPDNDNTMSIPLNQILFGPPGTGKTFNTINKAIAIINPEFDLDKPRNLIKDEYDRLVKAGQIVFTTFHQSMSYEDFIEGIKPKTENGSVTYKIQDGIFKEIANRASQTKQKYVSLDVVDGKQVLTEELFKDFYDQFASTLNSADQNESNCTLKTTEGYQFDLFQNSAGSISIKSGQKRTKMSASLNELTQVFFHDKPPVYKSYENVIIQKILEDKNYQESDSDNSEKKFVLIIDEINRGNVSQIFGELITLIEEDKRLGKGESLQVDLTYSKNKFGVPPNLYIIGTMNTADRSVEALDAALRRRFSFEEMRPKPELVYPGRKIWELWWEYPTIKWEDEPYYSLEVKLYNLFGIKKDSVQDHSAWEKMAEEGRSKHQIDYFKKMYEFKIDLQVLLTTINQRIEKLLDRDHQIGHSYFMSVASLDDLKVAFQNKIIPLLQEYFFGDYGKIGLVLGKGFVRKKNGAEDSFSFAKFDDYEDAGDLQTRDVFELIHYAPLSAKTDEDFINAINLLMNKN
jgi:5-methylcytosine-specific restriction enzyme B